MWTLPAGRDRAVWVHQSSPCLNGRSDQWTVTPGRSLWQRPPTGRPCWWHPPENECERRCLSASHCSRPDPARHTLTDTRTDTRTYTSRPNYTHTQTNMEKWVRKEASNAKILIYFSNKKYTEAILSNSTRKLLWFAISKMPIAV